jgi:hypothetical protein
MNERWQFGSERYHGRDRNVGDCVEKVLRGYFGDEFEKQ